MSPDLPDLTVVGAGPVGLFAAFYAGLRGMTTVVIDALREPGGQLTALYPEKPIYDVPGFPEIRAADLVSRLAAQAERVRPRMRLGERCEQLEQTDRGWKITTTGGSQEARAVLVCAGLGAFRPATLGVTGEARYRGRGLLYRVAEPQALRGRRVVVVGGGDSAVDWALEALPLASSVTLVHRREGFRALEERVAALKASDIVLRLWQTVAELKGEEQLEEIVLRHAQTGALTPVPCDLLIVAIGHKVALGALSRWGFELRRNRILVNQRQETSRPGIYAAGDACTHDVKLDLIVTGFAEACVAVNQAKHFLDPTASVFPGRSSAQPPPEPAG